MDRNYFGMQLSPFDNLRVAKHRNVLSDDDDDLLGFPEGQRYQPLALEVFSGKPRLAGIGVSREWHDFKKI